MCLLASHVFHDSPPSLSRTHSTTLNCSSIGSLSNRKGPFRMKTGIGSVAVVPHQPVLNLMTESFGGAGAPFFGSSNFTGPFHPASIMLTSSLFSGLFLFFSPTSLFFLGKDGGVAGGGAGGVERFLFFLDRRSDGHISFKGSSLGPLAEGMNGVFLNFL